MGSSIVRFIADYGPVFPYVVLAIGIWIHLEERA